MSTPLTAAQARPRRQPKSVDRLGMSVDRRARTSSAGPKRSRQWQTAGVLPVSPAQLSTCTQTQTVLATERDNAYSDVLALIFFHVFASRWASGVKAIPVLRLVCAQWAQCLQAQIRACDRLCVLCKLRYEDPEQERNLFTQQGASWLLLESDFMYRDDCDCEDNAWWLVRGPPRTLSDLPKWNAMLPVLTRLCEFELGSFNFLPPSPKKRWESFLEMLDGLAWLPVLASVTFVDEEEHICPSDEVECTTFLDGLKLRLGRLQHVHTLKGGLGFSDGTGPNVYGCLVDMPSLRHIEFHSSWAFADGDQYTQWFEEMVRALSSLRLETLKGLWSPEDEFWTAFTCTKQDRLRELEFYFGMATDPSEVSERFALIFDALLAMPELQVVTITDYDFEFNGVFEDGSGTPHVDAAIDGWQTMRALLLHKLTKRLTGDGDEAVFTSYTELLSQHSHCHHELLQVAVRCCHPNAVVNM